MNEQDYSLLHDYFNGLLPEAEAEAVIQRTQTDAAFAEAFALQQEMEYFPRHQARREAFVNILQNIEKEYFTQGNNQQTTTQPTPVLRAKTNWNRWMAIAAVMIGVAAVIWLIRPQNKLDYARFAQHSPLAIVERGSTDNNAAQAQSTFNQGQYERALPLLDQVIAAQPGLTVAQLYKGICLIELNRAAEARQILEPIADGATALKNEGLWYVALSYLKEKDLNACRNTLQRMPPDDPRYEQARKILE
jgi:anti-sigma-K factor RskA